MLLTFFGYELSSFTNDELQLWILQILLGELRLLILCLLFGSVIIVTLIRVFGFRNSRTLIRVPFMLILLLLKFNHSIVCKLNRSLLGNRLTCMNLLSAHSVKEVFLRVEELLIHLENGEENGLRVLREHDS